MIALALLLTLSCSPDDPSPTPVQATTPSAPSAHPGDCDPDRTRVARFHYRDDAVEDAAGLHMWIWGDLERDVPACAVDGFGAVFDVPMDELDRGEVLGFRFKQGADNRGPWYGFDRSWTAGDDCQEVWVAADSDVMHCDEREARALRILAAWWLSPTEVVVELSRPDPGLDDEERTVLRDSATPAVDISPRSIEVEDRFVRLEVDPLDIQRSYTVFVSRTANDSVELDPSGGVLDAFTTDLPLGSGVDDRGTWFRVWTPRATEVTLHTSPEPVGGPSRTHPMTRDPATGTWSATLAGDQHGLYYWYTVDGPRGAHEQFDPTRPLNDPWSLVALSSHAGTAGRSMVFDRSRLEPPTRIDRPPVQDLVVWEVHVRDLTGALSSGLPPAEPGWRGYLGFARRGLRGPGGVTTGLDHVLELGANAVQILPVQEFPGQPGRFDWGYTTVNYLSPEGSYATDPHGEARVHELKAMVDALHAEGIAVVLDLVLNHTGELGEGGPWINFRGLDSRYWYRRDSATGAFLNGSGVGNELATERPMVQRFVLDVVRHWVEVYGVDGFRFDLAGLIDQGTLSALARAHPDVYLYGEPWAASGPSWHKGDIDHIEPWFVFDDAFRDAIKGPPEGTDGGFVQGTGDLDAVRTAVSGSTLDFGTSTGWATTQLDGLRYLDCHDDLTLADKLAVSLPDASPEEREARVRLAAALTLTSPGPVLLHAGVEFMRTKPWFDEGDGRPVTVADGVGIVDANSYSSSDLTNNLDWELKAEHQELVGWISALVDLRLGPLGVPSRRPDALTEDSFEWFLAQDNPTALGYTLDADRGHGERLLRVFLNPSAERPATFEVIFDEAWRLVADAQQVDPGGLGTPTTGRLAVEPLGIRIYANGF